jgi:hypothetical protein
MTSNVFLNTFTKYWYIPVNPLELSCIHSTLECLEKLGHGKVVEQSAMQIMI